MSTEAGGLEASRPTRLLYRETLSQNKTTKTMPTEGGRRRRRVTRGQAQNGCPPHTTFRTGVFRFRPLWSLLLSESESLSILSLVAVVVTAVTVMTLRVSSSLSPWMPPSRSASGASLSEELTGCGWGERHVSLRGQVNLLVSLVTGQTACNSGNPGLGYGYN